MDIIKYKDGDKKMKIENIKIYIDKKTDNIYSDIYTNNMHLITDDFLKAVLLHLMHAYRKRNVSDIAKKCCFNIIMARLAKYFEQKQN